MKRIALSLMLVASLLAACAPIPAPASGRFEAGQVVLQPGQGLDDVQSGSVLTFVEIINDSRCPADAICVTSGFVQVMREVQQGEITRHETLTLGDLPDGAVSSSAVGEWTVTLVEVNPYPLASQPVEYADYSITLDLQAD